MWVTIGVFGFGGEYRYRGTFVLKIYSEDTRMLLGFNLAFRAHVPLVGVV